MNTFLIVGVESVVGANLAATWSEVARVFGLRVGSASSLPGCESASLDQHSAEGIRQCLERTRATHIVFCGAAARSSWEPAGLGGPRSGERGYANPSFANADAELWAAAAANADCHFTMISSDAVFTGPWMFHDEQCSALCPSPAAIEIRRIESSVQEICAKSLIVRTNAFGWSPAGQSGWLESLLSALENNRTLELDPICHGTPILASDLADYLAPALEDELTGVFHIAGAERVSPYQLAKQLASAFELSTPASRTIRELAARPTGFGRGEVSLQTRRFRTEYDCSMPMLSEGLTRLVQQHRTGHRDRLCGQATCQSKAA
ncbi:MAG: sugar nucleotide-binding protein [Planctomycetaceae bacterium]